VIRGGDRGGDQGGDRGGDQGVERVTDPGYNICSMN
jgi:hypothetical protein